MELKEENKLEIPSIKEKMKEKKVTISLSQILLLQEKKIKN